jgi:hypothetical protein
MDAVLCPPVIASASSASKVLIPGVSIDSTLLTDMYDAGYKQLAAFDYIPSIARITYSELITSVDLRTADCQDLPYESGSFDAVMDKGNVGCRIFWRVTRRWTSDWTVCGHFELARVLTPGGIFWKSFSQVSNLCSRRHFGPIPTDGKLMKHQTMVRCTPLPTVIRA